MSFKNSNEPVQLGIAGLGLAGAMLIRAARRDPLFDLVAAVDPLERPRRKFREEFGANTYENFQSLCTDESVEAIYIASPHEFHADQAIAALKHGKHVLVEKPMALTLSDCDRVIDAAERADAQLIVGHTHGFDPNIQQIGQLVSSGALGKLATILNFNYTDFLYRPRRPEELDTARGGGITFNQVMHQIEIARTIGGVARSVRANTGSMDPERPTEGNCTVFLEFENGGAATLIYSSYDFFDSNELHGWISEGGNIQEPRQSGETRRLYQEGKTTEPERQKNLGYGGRELPEEQPHLPHFGIVIVTCERGDIRLSADGIVVYGQDGATELPIEHGQMWAGHGNALETLRISIREGLQTPYDARWGKASIEIILAILQSAQERREIILSYQ